jgi:hypothetical protein
MMQILKITAKDNVAILFFAECMLLKEKALLEVRMRELIGSHDSYEKREKQ